MALTEKFKTKDISTLRAASNGDFFLDVKIFLKSFIVVFNQKIINQDKDLTMKRFDEQ